MKHSLLMLSTLCLLIVASCSKSNDEPEQETKNEITINGTSYSTAVIGSQSWTTVNYNGNGGVDYTLPNNPVHGKLYSLAEAKAIVLPTGWRLPSRDDYNKLLGAIGSTTKDTYGFYTPTLATVKKLMSKTDWINQIGTNESGFNAFPAGYFSTSFELKGESAVFLTTSYFTEFGSGWENIPVSFVVYSERNTDGSFDTNASFSDYVVRATEKGSIRFVKDN